MNLYFSQTTGIVTKEDGSFVVRGWAGHGEGKNNPAMQDQHSLGPLPQGRYEVGPWEEHHPGLGPMVAHLTMIEGEAYGRDGFFIHGPAMDPAHYGEESKGCIVVPRQGREVVRSLSPAYIFVTA